MSESETRAATESTNRQDLRNPALIMSESESRAAIESANRHDLRNAAIEFANGVSGENPRPESIILRSCQRMEFMVPLAVAEQSGLVKSKIDKCPIVKRIPLFVTTPLLELMISFWIEHVGSDEFTKEREEEVRIWENRFFDQMDLEQLLDLEEAAYYMDAKEMLDRTSDYILQLPIRSPQSSSFRLV